MKYDEVEYIYDRDEVLKSKKTIKLSDIDVLSSMIGIRFLCQIRRNQRRMKRRIARNILRNIHK